VYYKSIKREVLFIQIGDVKSGFILFIKNYQFPLQINTLERECAPRSAARGETEDPRRETFLFVTPRRPKQMLHTNWMLRNSAALLVAAAAADAFAGTNGFMMAPSGISSPIVCTTVSADTSFCILIFHSVLGLSVELTELSVNIDRTD
jgi:hypothetical protein